MFNGITRRRTKLRPVAAIALLCAVVVISACSTATTGNQGGGQGSGMTGTITVSSLTGQAYLPDAIAAFKQKNPGLSVRTTQAVSNTYQAQIRAQLDAKHGPDVMFVWGGSGNAMATKILAEAGELADLSQSPWVKSIGSTANELVNHDGKVYALNSYQNPIGVEYNAELMNKLNVTPPTTFSGLLDFCKTVSAQGIIPIAIGAQTGYLAMEVPLEMANTLVYSKDPQFAQHLADGSVKWSTSQLWKDSLRTALQQFTQMQEAKCLPDNATGYSDMAANQLVASGKALGVDIIAAAISDLKKQAPSMKLDMFTVPATENPADTVLTLNTGAAYAVAASSANKEAATALVDYLGEPAQLAAASQANYGVPYTPTPDVSVAPEMNGIAARYKSGKTALLETNYWPGYQVKQTMIAECQNLLTGRQSVQGVVDAVQKSLADS